MEKELRKQEYLVGTWVPLGDGEKWCVPALPLGKRSNEILEKLEKLFELRESVSQLLTDGNAKEQVKITQKIFAAAAEMAFAALHLNYPKLSQEYFDETCLVTTQHISIFESILQGETKIGEVIGGRNSNSGPGGDSGELKAARS